jgi:anaerobic magnesium-protoporphyrin IX monomethyl ester cyclase
LSTDVLLIEDLSQQHLPARTLAAVLQRAGRRVRLAHFGPEDREGIRMPSPDNIITLAQRKRPRLIVFSILFADRVPETLALITAMRQSGVGAHTTMVGPLPSFAANELLTACPALDSVLCGEAEASVTQLACLQDSKGLPNPSGLATRCDNGTIQWQAVPNLDALPFPLHHDLPEYAGYGFATIESSRGCYHACTFCLPCAFYRAAGAPYRLRSIVNLVDEIEALYRRGTRLFLFDDEQFLPRGRAREGRVEALGRELERRNLSIAFTIKCRADDVDAPLFRRLKAMGLLRVYVGIESGCQATLDLFGKHVTAQRNAEALTTLDELGIVADFRSLLFHPWSTLESIQADIAFLHSVMPHVPTSFDFREVEVYPGTPLAARLRAEGSGVGDPWPLAYTIADPRAELLRRLMHIVFSGAHARFQEQITQAWFDLLLRRRFQPAQFDVDRAQRLKADVARVNAESLDVWRDMLAFAGESDIYNAEFVNERAAEWAARINQVLASLHASCYS